MEIKTAFSTQFNHNAPLGTNQTSPSAGGGEQEEERRRRWAGGGEQEEEVRKRWGGDEGGLWMVRVRRWGAGAEEEEEMRRRRCCILVTLLLIVVSDLVTCVVSVLSVFNYWSWDLSLENLLLHNCPERLCTGLAFFICLFFLLVSWSLNSKLQWKVLFFSNYDYLIFPVQIQTKIFSRFKPKQNSSKSLDTNCSSHLQLFENFTNNIKINVWIMTQSVNL